MRYLSDEIQKRQIDDWLIQVRITTNPHLEPKNARPFVESLLAQRRRLHGDADPQAQLDLDAVKSLKDQLSKESRSIGVK